LISKSALELSKPEADIPKASQAYHPQYIVVPSFAYLQHLLSTPLRLQQFPANEMIYPAVWLVAALATVLGLKGERRVIFTIKKTILS
jgi:hypothetical protein